MIYAISFFYITSFIFACLTVATIFSLNKARMYPPKKILRQKMSLYAGGSLLFFLIGWCFYYF